MAELTLGLDLGPTSIGWALIEDVAEGATGPGRIVAAGVRVFPEGVDRDSKGTEISKNAQRRLARQQRRQIDRRARRRLELRRALVQAGLLPEEKLLPREDRRRVEWEKAAFRDADPYELRARALSQKLTPHELGRALLHLGQRRGFLSNRKTDRARDAKEQSALLEEINQLQADLGDRTLGQYLHAARGGDAGKVDIHVRLRGRHTQRSMYEHEFDAIWTAQQPHHPRLLTDDLRERLRHAIFYQRPLKPPPADLIGRCELEPRLPRCPRADRRTQRFRLYAELNNLELIDTSAAGQQPRTLTEEEHQRLVAYLSAAKERSFDDIRKHLFKDRNPDAIRFNLERGERTKLKGIPIDYFLAAESKSKDDKKNKTLIGKKWRDVPDELKDRIVAAIIDDNEDRLRYLLAEAGLDSERAPDLLERTPLESGYASYSLCAIKKLLPHLEQRLPLTSAKPEQPCALRQAGYVMPWEHPVDQVASLPPPPDVTNPLVRAALVEVQKLVNAILREWVHRAGHTLTNVRIELAREVRGTAKDRARRTAEMRDREKCRDTAADAIREQGHKPTRDAIDRYLLWKEQREECLYTGDPISIGELLGGRAQLDHILPYSRSLDDSLENLVICKRDANAEKGNRTPHEWLARTQPARYDAIILRARKLGEQGLMSYGKFRRLQAEAVQIEDFIQRNLRDTAYIASRVREYMLHVCPNVLCPKGAHTATLRQEWGLNTVLRHDGEDIKNRDDHRHHAVDAIIIALTDHRRLQALSPLVRRNAERHGEREQLPPPWPDFRAQVEEVVNKINVSHRVRRGIRGALHNETIYGPTPEPGHFVYRKPLEALTPAMVPNIRDDAIRALVEARLKKFGVAIGRKRKGASEDDGGGASKIPAEAWKDPLLMASGVRVRKVRIIKTYDAMKSIRGGSAWVEPGNTHHICIFEWENGNGETLREAIFCNMLEATRRRSEREPIIQQCHPDKPNARFVMSIGANELFQITREGKSCLYRFETSASTVGRMWFRVHTYAGPSTVRDEQTGRKARPMQISETANTLDARKVTVDRLGRIRWAND